MVTIIETKSISSMGGTSMFTSLKSKMIIPLVAILILMVLLIVVYVSLAVSDLTLFMGNERISFASQAAIAHFELLEEMNLRTSQGVAASPEVIRFINNINAGIGVEENRRGLLNFLLSRKPVLGIDAFVVADRNGYFVLRSHDPEHYGDPGSHIPPIA